MFKINYDKKITMVQGDTGVIRMRIHNYELSQGDEVRFAIANKANPSILLCQHSDKKIVLEKQVTVFEKDGSARIVIYPDDTEYLQPGKYLYEIQVKTKDGRVDTVVPLTSFTLMDGSIQGEYGQTTPSKPEPTPSEIELRFKRLEDEIIPELGTRISNVENEIDNVNSSLDNVNSSLDNIKIIQGVNVEDFKRLDSESTDVGRINRAIQYAKENNINIVNFAPITYDVTDGTIVCDWKVDLVGYGGVNSTTFDKRGTTVLNAYNSITEEPVIKYSINKGSFIMGVRFSNFCIIGCDNWYQGDVKKWSNRTAIHLENVAREYKLEDISIIGFKKHAIKGVNLWDGSAFGLAISFCGTDGLYPAVYFTGDRENSNAGHWYGIHMEHVPYMMKFDSGTRHMQITDSKFEVGEQKALNSYIQIDESCQEILFKGNQFVNNNYSDVSTSLYPHMFKINNRHTVFDNNMFASPTPTGALWIDASESNGIKIVNNNFNFMAGLDYSIKLKDNSQVHCNTFWVNTHANTGRKRGIFVDGWFNTITNNYIRTEVTSDNPTEGAIFSCTTDSTNNVFVNRFQNGFKSFMRYNIPNNNNIIMSLYPLIGVINDNSGKPKMNIESDVFYLENTNTTYINDFIHHKYINKKITLIGKEEYTKIVNGTAIKTKDGNTINMTKGRIVKFIYCDVGDGYQWVEV